MINSGVLIMDIWSKKKRSEVMSKIKSRNTIPEIKVRKVLHSNGYRFRINVKRLPGSPDIVLKKYNAVIFVNGCFWHLHENCRDGTIPKTRSKYWQEKLLKNKERDKNNTKQLQTLGWRVLHIWECDIKKGSENIIKILNNFVNK